MQDTAPKSRRFGASSLRHILRLVQRLRLNEVAPLLTIAVVGLLGWGFVELAGEVREGDAFGFDRTILLALREPGDLSDPIGPAWLEESARDLTALGSHTILGLVTIVTVLYLALSKRSQAARLVVVAVVGGMLLTYLLKLGFDRPRPDLVPHGVRVYTASFPSGHAMLSAVTYLTLGALLARLHADGRLKVLFLGLAVALTVVVGLSRVYLGVHWPSDVLAGWSLGAAWAGACQYAALLLQGTGRVEPETVPAAPQPDGISRRA